MTLQAEKREYLYWEWILYGNQKAVRKGNWKYVRFDDGSGKKELYDLSTDIGEQNNLAGLHPGIVIEMDEIISQARS